MMPCALAASSLILVGAYLAIWGRRYGLDLSVYRDSVRSWRLGDNPYLSVFTQHRLPFTYPPSALQVFAPLAWVSFPAAQVLLWIASISAAAGSVVLVLRDRGMALSLRTLCIALAWSCTSVIILEPVRSGLDYGQIEFVLMFIVVGDLLAAPSRYRGIALGVAAAIKLTPLVFLVVLVVSRDIRSAIRALLSFLTLTTLSWLMWPGLSRAYWAHDVFRAGRVGTISYSGNQSWLAVLHRPPIPSSLTGVTWVFLATATLGLGAFIAWRCVRMDERVPAIVSVALAGLLISPISWSHHWMWVLLIPPVLFRRQGSEIPKAVQLMLWGVVALTILSPYWWFNSGVVSNALDAVLPVWTFALLVAWGGIELARIRGARMLEPQETPGWRSERTSPFPSGAGLSGAGSDA